MSSSYSANQYDSAFRPQRLQNWCETKHLKERPTAQKGHTTIIANDRGHLLPGVVKRGSAWPDFKGTWDLPDRIPAHRINPTSRSVEGLNRLKSWGFDIQDTAKSQPHRGSIKTDRLQDGEQEQTNGDVQQDGAAPSSAAEARPASQNLTGGERAASQNQDSQAAVVGSAGQPAEEKQTIEAAGRDGLPRHGSATEAKEKPALRPAAGEGTNSRPGTGTGRPASNVAERAASQGAPSSSKQRHRDAQQEQ